VNTAQEKRLPPPGLEHGRPRPAQLTAGGRAVAVLSLTLAASAVAAGIWLYLAADRDRARRQLVLREGLVAEGEVVELRRLRRGDSNDYLVTYQYTTPGHRRQAQARVGRAAWQRLRIGYRLPIRYLASSPEQAWIKGYEPRGVPMGLVPLAPLCLAVTAWALVWVLRRQWRLVTEGRPALARVTGSKGVQGAYGGQGVQVSYEFPILSGATRKGQYGPVKKTPALGETLWILYDPEKPARTSRYPLSLVRAG